jgi:uncharacterized membrane protein YdjX (TVP38/TMEM64 family)
MPDAVPATAPLPPAVPARIWFTLGAVPVTTGRLILGVVGTVVLVGMSVGWSRIDLPALHARAEQLPGPGVIGIIATIPLLGVPVALLHVVAGVRFGIVNGLIVVGATTLFHHIVGYSLVKLEPRVFAEKLRAWRARFPRGAHRAMTVFSCLLPGMPYAVQLYLLPVLGVPLRILLTVSVPLHTGRAIISIVGGDLLDELTPGKVAWFGVYYLVLTAVCALAFRRIRRELRTPRSVLPPSPPAG